MAITASGLYYQTFAAIVTNAQAVDISAETYKGALYNNSITPNFSSDTTYAAAPYTSNEVTGTNWASGGVALTGTAVSDVGTAGVLGLDATDVSVASTTLSNAQGYLWYATGVNSGMCIVLVNFGAPYSTNNGTFGITWAANGVFTIDLTP